MLRKILLVGGLTVPVVLAVLLVGVFTAPGEIHFSTLRIRFGDTVDTNFDGVDDSVFVHTSIWFKNGKYPILLKSSTVQMFVDGSATNLVDKMTWDKELAPGEEQPMDAPSTWAVSLDKSEVSIHVIIQYELGGTLTNFAAHVDAQIPGF